MRTRIFGLLKARTLVLILLCLGIGYLGGQSYRLEKLRHSLRPLWSLAHGFKLPSGPPPELTKGETYAQLHALLDARLEEQRRVASEWKRLLETADGTEQRLIIAGLRSKFRDLLHPWPGPATDL